MKVSFLTDSGFLSHKIEILKGLNERVNLQVIIFFVPGLKNFSKEDILNFAEENNISLLLVEKGQYRSRDLRRIRHDYKNIIKPIRKFNPDACYIESFGSPYVNILSALFLPRKKVVVGIHDYLLHELDSSKTPFSARVYQWLSVRSFKHFHFFSFSQRDVFQSEWPRKNTYVIRLYLVGKSYSDKKEVDSDNRTHFLFFGRIFYYKGVDLLIKAGHLLGEKSRGFLITIAGKSDKPEQIKQLIRDSDLFDLRLEHIPKDEIPDYFNQADFLVAPYRKVTQSGPLLIGYNYEVIPIASDEPGFEEYIEDGNTGLLFENGSAEALAACMEKAINMNLVQRAEMNAKISNFKEQEFDLESILDKYIKMFAQVNGKAPQ